MQALTPKSFKQALAGLTKRDPNLAQIAARCGNTPFWTHTPGFPGLSLAILAQQVSLESAMATYRKMEIAIPSLLPNAFLELKAEELRNIGFSRQKASYVRGLAENLLAGKTNLEELRFLGDNEVRARLMQIRGIGKWTADTYLLFSLRRPDVWPSGDLALEKAVSEMRGASAKLNTDEVDRLALAWKPFRAVAARMIWFKYLFERKRLREHPHA